MKKEIGNDEKECSCNGPGSDHGSWADRLRQQLPDKTVWAFSGYTWEELTGQSRARCEATGALLSLVDVLVDGEFVEALRDISLRFRVSSNQRLLDVPASLAGGRPIPWEG